MASDPSLIEISGEDDSLLQQIPTDDVARNFFSCSPLQIHGSKPHLPSVDSLNKENVNLNKYEMLKLSLEPQQMKRKKKGGGYNLRKSLAWDRAFSTEEGFLDPVELSMISGNVGSSTGEKLPVIHEEGGESLSEFPNSESDSGDLLALKEKLFKELPVKTKNEGRTKHSSSPHQRDALTKRDGALVSSTKRKVLSNYDVNSNRSKRSGSLQSAALSSPVNVNSTKATSKEVKASIKPATKPDSSLRTPIAKIASRVGQPKHSQLAHSGTAHKNNAGVKVSSSNKTHSRPSTRAGPCSKPPPIAKSIVPQAKRNLGKLASRSSSLTHRNDSSVEIEGRKNPLARDNGAGSSKVEAAHPEKAHLPGGSIQHVQLKAAKPSGLRMPSPSLGFFCQPKASTKGLLNSFTQPSDDPQSATGSSKSCTAVKPVSELKPPHVREKVQDMISDDTNPNMGLSMEVSAKSLDLEYQKQNADPESQNVSKTKLKIQHDALENHQMINGFVEDGSEGLHRPMELHKVEIKPRVDDGNMPVGNDIPFVHTGPCGKEKKSNYEKSDTIGSQCVEGPPKVLTGNAAVFSHSPSADSSVCRTQSSFGLPDHQLHCAEGVPEFSEEVELVESHIYDNDQTSIANQENRARFMGVGSSEEFQKNCEENTDNSNEQDDNVNKEERSCVLPLKLAEQADSGFRALPDSSTELHIEDSENLVFYGSLTVSDGGTSLAGDHAAGQVTCENKGANENDGLLVGAKCMMSINEQPEVHAAEQVAHEKERAIENDDILLIDFRAGGECQDNALMIEYSPLICKHACEVLLNSSTALCPVPPSDNVHQSDEAKRLEVLYAEENQSAQQESEPMVENSASFSDRQSTNNMYFPGQVGAFNLGSSLMVNRDQKTVAATDGTSASFVSLGSDHCSGIKGEDRYVTTPHVSVVQDGDDNMLMELKECDDVEEKQILQSVKSASASLMTGRPLQDTLTGTELLSGEVDNSSHEDSHFGSKGQHQKLKGCNLPDVSVYIEHPSGQDDADQTNEEFHNFDIAMKYSSAVAGQQQLLDGSSFVDCSLKMNRLAGDDNFSMASHRNEQSGYQLELHNPCFMAELDSHAHQGLSSNDEIVTMDDCLTEPKRSFTSSSSLCQDDVSRSECPKADVCSQVEPVLQDNSGDRGTIYEDPNVEDVLLVSVQKYQSNIYGASLEDDVAVDVNREEFPEAEGDNVMISSCQSSEEVGLDVKNDEAELPVNNQCIGEASQSKSSILPEKADSSASRESFSYDVRRQHLLGSTLNSSKYTTTLVQGEICKKDGKQESAIVKPPPDAAPFSEEWLAAFEAAGEEILTMKCGAVQNSPPDKTLPEPSPWSPVKRKSNQAIGPYDCTKFTNICNSVPESSSE